MKENGPVLFYQKRMVAFLDVMGFKALLASSPHALEALQKFYDDTIDFLEGKTQVYEQTAAKDGFRKMFVSDAVILTVEMSEDHNTNLNRAERFFSAISLLQYLSAIKSKTWMRGAVSVGDLFIDEKSNILVGPAFVEAFELEKKANYPRVIVHPKVCGFFGKTAIALTTEINSVRTSAKLLCPNPSAPWGRNLPTNRDAIQIDWFRQAFDRRESTTSFFLDLQTRMNTSQDLFEKGQLLLSYIRESYDDFSLEQGHHEKGNERLIEVDSKLKFFGY